MPIRPAVARRVARWSVDESCPLAGLSPRVSGMIARLFIVCMGLLLAMPASAQGFFKLDAVFVSRFLAQPDTLDGEAQTLQRKLEEYLGQSYLVSPLDKVPPFRDYSAAVYLENCPPHQYNECSYVIAGRAKADWAITARYTSDNPYDQFADRDVEVTIIDIKSSRAVISFGASVGPGREDVFAQGVMKVLANIVSGGDASNVDIREGVVDERAEWEKKREAAAEAAEELSDYEDIDLVVRGMTFDDELSQPKIKVDDLEEYDDRDDAAPWERLDMGREEYVRYKNSGRSITEWKQLRLGRQRQIVLRGGTGGGRGPFFHNFDARVALDDQTLQPVETDVFLELTSAAVLAGDFEVGFGITPTLEISVGMTLRTGWFQIFTLQEVVGDPELNVGSPTKSQWWTPAYHAKVYFTPLPTSPVRPTMSAGAQYWRGAGVLDITGDPTIFHQAVQNIQPWDETSQIFALVGGGGEFRLSEKLDFYTRADLQFRVAGSSIHTWHDGQELLFNRGEPLDNGGPLGFQVGAGIIVGLSPFGKPDVGREYDPLLDDEPDF